MLQYRTIQPGALRVLKALMEVADLKDFYLVGGTALSLFYGHRLSVDIDLFSISQFQNEAILLSLKEANIEFAYKSSTNPIGLFGISDGVKVDLVKHYMHPLIDETLLIDGIRIFSPREIMAMKVSAILRRGVKKDFYDLAELFLHFSVAECIDAYERKYPSQQLLISIPNALTYFEDAENGPDPISLKNHTWEKVKSEIRAKVREYLE